MWVEHVMHDRDSLQTVSSILALYAMKKIKYDSISF